MADRPLRIAFFLPTFPELSNTFILTQITGLIDRGHLVDLFAIERKRFEDAQPDVARYGLASRMRHLYVPRRHGPRLGSALRILLGPGGRHPALLDALNPVRHGRSAWNLVHLHTAASFLRAEPYDVVHCQFGDHGPALDRLMALGAVSANLVTSFRGADVTIHLAPKPQRFRALFRRGALFLPVSRDFRERLIAVGAPADRVHVHRSGIDLSRFAFVPRRPGPGPVKLLFVGRLTEKKGLAYLLEALALLHAAGHDAELTVIGDGPLANQLRERTVELAIGNRVAFTGSCSQDEVVQHLRASHVLVAPSVTAGSGDQEGIPNVLKEAMATGMPVVSTYHAGIPELVEDGVSGFLAPERDAAALASCLIRVIEHPQRWAAWGEAGRRTIERDFDANVLNDRLVELYRSTLRDAPLSSATAAKSAEGERSR